MNSVQKDSVSFSQAAAGLGQHFLCLGFSMIVRCCEAAWAARPELKFTALAIRPLHYSWYKKISTYSKKYSRFFIKGNFVIFLCFRWHFWNTWEVLAIAAKVQNIVLINPTRRGAFKAPLNKNFFGTFLWSKWPQKIWLFLDICDKASHTLCGDWNGQKRGF